MMQVSRAALVVGCGLALAAGIAHFSFCSAVLNAEEKADKSKATSTGTSPANEMTLEKLCTGRLRIVDLTYALSDTVPHWPSDDYEPFKLKTLATIEKNGWLSKGFYTPEHLGTHMDAPNHYEKNQLAVNEIKPENLFAPGVVIDVAAAAAANADHLLTSDEIARWEQEHGAIPQGAVVLLHTGWGRHWKTHPRYLNQDVMGRMHFPGFSVEAARLLIGGRKAKGLGIDTLSIDYGMSRDFAVHHVVNGAGCYGLENLANLDQLPPRGFYLTIAPIKIETGSGGPTRVFAVCGPAGDQHAGAAPLSQAQEPQADGLAPFGGKPQAIPGTVEFENFDEGREGVAFHDSEAANDPKPTAHRKTAVDLEVTPDKKIILIGHIKTGEWLKYTVEVTKSGAYEIELGASVQGVDPPEIRIEFDGVDVSGPIQFTTKTQRWYLFHHILGPIVDLKEGRHIMRAVVVKSPKGSSLNLDYVRFVAKREPKKS